MAYLGDEMGKGCGFFVNELTVSGEEVYWAGEHWAASQGVNRCRGGIGAMSQAHLQALLGLVELCEHVGQNGDG